MTGRNSFMPLVEEVDFVIAERRNLRARGVHLIVTHLDHVPNTPCFAGEVIGSISLGGQPMPAPFGLAHMSLLLMDCLCRYRMPLSAAHIEEIMNTDPFYVEYATTRIGRGQVIAKPDRRTVRVYVPRIWKRMERVFQNYKIPLDPRKILTAETTDTNVVVYRLKATSEVVHFDQQLDKRPSFQAPCAESDRGAQWEWS